MTSVVAQPFSNLGPQSPAEKRKITWDFSAAGWLAAGETISSAVVTGTNPLTPGDPVAAAMVIGAAEVINATQVTQFIGLAGVIGTSYQFTCTINTSAGQVLSLTGNMVIAIVLGVAT
jgi:hypothetical protein